MNSSRPVTIKDIARRFRCSPSTVSRALNDHPAINEDTRKNIQEYAREVGYQRNEVSLSLLNKKTATLGVVVPTIGNYYETAVIEGLHTILQPLGYTLNICVTNENYLLEKEYLSKLLSNRTEGIFLSVSQETYDAGYYEHLESVIQRKTPLIFIDREYEDFETSRATVDDYHGAFAAVEHLLTIGYKNIAHLKGPNGLTVSEQRFKGYRDCLKKYDIPIKEELIINTNFKVESAIVPTKRLLDLDSPPDAIFGVNDQVAIGAMRVILDRGLKIPGDVGIIGFDNSPISAYTYPSLTTVHRPGRKIGMEASRLFLNQLNGSGDFVHENIVLPTELIIRESSLRIS
ncbi:transcriptional regulator, LacI family [Dyadobacter koreensis]|uniref:Transcriptional regulator, LacI family n=1 Tax=Dyadobacter koreensis TaxID=408657 RepID=A0A1H6Q8A4_9BACT|nr:LacI family DNA-binding transcriptional regulator [Dyadobacter koreensis]SEI37064.1 transcriptional regulator, LacI family [Dyadobacter koreensis]